MSTENQLGYSNLLYCDKQNTTLTSICEKLQEEGYL